MKTLTGKKYSSDYPSYTFSAHYFVQNTTEKEGSTIIVTGEYTYSNEIDTYKSIIAET